MDQAESGEEALEKIAQNPPDILLLDHKMPGISGLDVFDRIAQRETDMLTIMITAYASIETAVTATKRGAYDFLAKPFTPDELKSTIRKAAARLILAKQARKLAEEKRRVRFDFIRILGHELKAPLGAVTGYLDMLKNHAMGENLGPYAEIVGRSLARVEGMRKVDCRSARFDPDRIGARRTVSRPRSTCARLRWRSSTPRRPIRPPGTSPSSSTRTPPVPLTADRREIEMLLNNLLSNAVKYNRDGGRVDVTLARHGARVTIAVADTGIGNDRRGDVTAVRRIRSHQEREDRPHPGQRPGIVDRQEAGPVLRRRRDRRERARRR